MLFFAPNPVFAQSYYNQLPGYIKANSQWGFGNGFGLDFNTSPPDMISSAGTFLDGSEGFASVADPVTGQVLFHSNGARCWNASNLIMQNGDTLLGNSLAGFEYKFGSTHQGVCIVPFINQPGKYYLFSLKGTTNWILPWIQNGFPLEALPNDPKLYYSVIDMSLDGGLGGIVAGQKNIPLTGSSGQPLGESMIAVPGDNCDIWLIVHDYLEPVFRAFHITGEGIDPNPVLSTTGSEIQGLVGWGAYYTGDLAVSPNRGYLAITSWVPNDNNNEVNGLLLCKFDPATGMVSDALRLSDQPLTGLDFSPDNNKLYTVRRNLGNSPSSLLQFDVSVFDAATIAATEQIIGNLNASDNLPSLKSYNGKIYANSGGIYLDVVNEPNLAGATCDFQNADANLMTLLGDVLPNDVVYAFPPDTSYTRREASLCMQEEGIYAPITLEAFPGFEGYLWSDGSEGDTLPVNQPGLYWVVCKDACHSIVDTIMVEGVDILVALGNDTVLCNGASLSLDVTLPEASYLWQDNSANSSYTVSGSGTYWVQVTSRGCAAADTISISALDLEQDLGNDTSVCDMELLASGAIVLAVHVPEGSTVTWSDGSHENTLALTGLGTYWVTVTNQSCMGRDTVIIDRKACQCQVFFPNAFSPNGDGLNDLFRPVLQSGCTVQRYVFSVYNRYGTRVWHSYDPAAGWDGRYANGVAADVGTYMFEVAYSGGETVYHQKGDLTLIR